MHPPAQRAQHTADPIVHAVGSRAGRLIDPAIGAAIVLLIASPLLFTNRGFQADFTNHLWLIWHQGLAISDTGHPTLFVHAAGLGLFNPFFGFYGGTLYGLTGGLSAVFGNRPELALQVLVVVMVAMAYGGTFWLARQAGVRGLWAHAPATVFVCSAYYITDLYSRGAIPEFVALSCLPMVIAAGIRLLTGPWTARVVGAFAFSCILLSGSHNISLMWATIILVLIAGAAFLLLGAQHRGAWRRWVAVGALAAVSAGVNAWFLLLDVRHSSDTFIGQSEFRWGDTAMFNTPWALLDPLRLTPSGSTTHGLTVVAPVVALLWAIGAFVAARRQGPTTSWPLSRLWALATAGTILLLVFIMWKLPWTAIGKPFTLTQFPYRLNGWVAMGATAMVVLSLRRSLGGPERHRRWVLGTLGVVVALSVVQGGLQVWSPENVKGAKLGNDRAGAFARGPGVPPVSWYDPGVYRDVSRPQVDVPAGRIAALPLPSPGANEVSALVTLPPGDAPFALNMGGGPYVTRVSGVTPVGRTVDALLVVKRNSSASQAHITVTAAGGRAQTAGVLITVVCLLALVALMGALAVRRRRAPGA
jgi:hypothetical protein